VVARKLPHRIVQGGTPGGAPPTDCGKTMLITDIGQTKKGRYSIFCDGEFYCSLHADVFAPSRLKTGAEIARGELDALHRRSELKITTDRALRLLSVRSYSAHGLRQKLAAYTDEESADAATARMAELGYINDLDYARRLCTDCINRKGFSAYRAKQALREKGIAREIIEQVMDERDDDPEPQIAAVVLRKYMRFLEDEKGFAKTTNALLRLGYRHGDIRRVLENLMEDAGYYDDWEE